MSGDLSQDPGIQRSLVTAYTQILRVFEDMRQQATELDELLTVAALQDEIREKLELAQARLASIEATRHALARSAVRRNTPGAGRSPVDEGHGCPALSPAVGPATTGSQTADITAPDKPLLFVQQLQKLPEVNQADNLERAGEKIRC